MESYQAMTIMISFLLFLAIEVILFILGNMKAARILLCLCITVITLIGAIASHQYYILIFSLIAFVFTIWIAIFDDETNVWNRKK